MSIPFNKPYQSPNSLAALKKVLASSHTGGNGPYGQACQAELKQLFAAESVFLTASCTAALEICALLLDLQPGDEVILPAFTHMSTANPFVMLGAVPVFVESDMQSLTLQPSAVEEAITPKTKAIIFVHYGAPGPEIEAICQLAKARGLQLIEDAATAIGSTYQNKPLGSWGDLGVLSFHQTKNITCGEGGALIVNNPDHHHRAQTIWHKGTNRVDFEAKRVEAYTWQTVGLSYWMSEYQAAVLSTQLAELAEITAARQMVWEHYHRGLAVLEAQGYLSRPNKPQGNDSHDNAHVYYFLVENKTTRESLINTLAKQGIKLSFHYMPLHLSDGGKRYGRADGCLANAERIAACLVRLPLWVGLTAAQIDTIIQAIEDFYATSSVDD